MKAEIRIVFQEDGGINFMSRGIDSVDTTLRVGALYSHMNHLAKSANGDVKLVYGALGDFMRMIDDGVMTATDIEIKLPKDS